MPEELNRPFTVVIDREADAAVVKCSGRLVSGTVQEFLPVVKPLLSQTKRLVVDLAGVEYVDSTGVGALVRLYTSARNSGCELRLLHLGKQVRNVLRLANLLSVFGQAEDHGINIA